MVAVISINEYLRVKNPIKLEYIHLKHEIL